MRDRSKPVFGWIPLALSFVAGLTHGASQLNLFAGITMTAVLVVVCILVDEVVVAIKERSL